MPTIHLTTFIKAPVVRVFDLSRSISFHENSMAQTEEKAIAGKTLGLVNINDTITWQAKHLLKKRTLESKITAMEPFTFFEDTMLKGDFVSLRHEHHFKKVANGTIMIDVFEFESPYGKIGSIVNTLVLKKYLTRFLITRNEMLKHYAESDKLKTILS